MNRRYIRTILLLLIALLLLSGCGRTDNSKSTEEAPVGSVADVIDAEDQTTFVDFCRTESGYAVLSVKNSGPVVSCRDAALDEIDQAELGFGDSFAIAVGGGHRWIAAIGESGNIEILCDDSSWLDTKIGGYLYQSQLAWEDDILYSVLNRSLWIGQTKVELPENASGTRYQVYCVARIGGQMYALVTATSGVDAAGQWLCPIDASTTKLELPERSFPLRAESALWDGDTTWMLCDSVLFRTDGSACSSVCDLSASGVEIKELLRILPDGNGGFLVLQKDGILRIDPSAGQEAKTLIMGVYTLYTDCDAAIAAFNRAGTGWVIRAKYFNDMETMNLALLNGELDLVCSLDQDMMRNYAAKGLLAPIDPDLTAQVLPNVAEACTERGNCCYLPRAFTLYCSTVPSSYVEDLGDLRDLDRVIGIIDRYCPEFYEVQTKQQVLSQVLQYCGRGWIDWDHRTADFTGDSFLTFLRFANRCADDEQNAINAQGSYWDAGKRWLTICRNMRLDFYHAYQEYDPEKTESAYLLFSFPVGDFDGYAMVTKGFYAAVEGKNAEGTAAFLRFLFSDESWFDEPGELKNAFDVSYPVNAARCEALIEKQADTCLNSPNITPLDWAAEAAKWLEEIKRADHFYYTWTNELHAIIEEEAEPYFHGDITAEEAARRIQNRVEIYLAERG